MEWHGDLPHDHAFVELLAPGVPSELDIQQLLRDTEDKLKLNACSIEESLKELQAKMGDSWTGERPPSPSECLQWFSPRNAAAGRPLATGHQEVMDFLKALQLHLRSEAEGREESTLQLLLNLSSQCAVSFPCSPSIPAPQQPSALTPPVHAVRDDCTLEVQEAWDEVRLVLRRHLLERLSQCRPAEPQGPGEQAALSIPERVTCLQQLFCLYPEAEVLQRYQGLRSQAVLHLLHSCVSSSPGGETGFSRLAQGLQAAAPALIRALRDELRVLTRLAEPHAILGFLNGAYLGTVAKELAAMMERECETTLKENTAPGSGKTRRCSARSKVSVAPLQVPRKDRSFSLTSHQLRALTQLACTLLGLEAGVEELLMDVAFINCTGESPNVKGILKKTKEDAHTITGEGSRINTHLVTNSPEAVALDFDWRTAFRQLVPQMAHCVKVVLEDVCSRSLKQEEESHAAGHTSITLSNTPHHDDSSDNLSEQESPKMVAKFCADIQGEVEALLPLALACREGPLLEVRCSFVEVCGRVAASVLDRLEQRAAEVPASAPLKNLPSLLATGVYVHQRLCHYNSRLRESPTTTPRVPLILLPIQRYQNGTEAIRDHLTSYSVQACATSLLQDAESHHWADPKPFYEGERCSFSLQMWYCFLCGLRSDLWGVLPARLARELLGQVLYETLQLLVQRYSRARPTYKRHLQIRCDITAVLLYVEELMWSVCDSPEALVRPDPYPVALTVALGGGWRSAIYSLCDQLLTVMVVVTAPLPSLCGTLQSDLGDGVKPPDPMTPACTGLHWLHAIDPDLFTEQSIREGVLTGDQASVCQLKLLTSDPGSSPQLLLQALLQRDCHLPRTLLELSHFCVGEDSELNVPPENKMAGDEFIGALFTVLVSLNHVPKALTHALAPYLDAQHVWEHFYHLADLSRPCPAVVGCVRSLISRPLHGLLEHLVYMLLDGQAPEEAGGAHLRQDVPGHVLAKVPREWSYAPLEHKRKEAASSTVSLALQALSFILSNLPSAVASLPLPVRYLLHAAERHLSQPARQLRSVGLLLWALLGCLCQSLEAPEALEQRTGLPLGRASRERLALLSECLQATMGQQRGIPKPIVHKVLQALEERKPKWSSVQLQRARKLCSESAFECGESGVGMQERVGAAELTEQKIGLMLLEICHKPGGSEYLGQIYHIIRGNEDLLMSKLTKMEGLARLVKFDLGADGPGAAPSFNPLVQFERVGTKKLDQVALADWPWDWTRLLPAYRGMNPLTFKTLLANRWEMQDGAALEVEEKALVDELQKDYFNPSPGTQGPAGDAQEQQGEASGTS
ncbi:uncharacterized protein KIAA0825 homolog [Aplochiton taeniatus]